MKPFIIATFASASILAACSGGDAPKTTADLLIGEWDQVAPVTINEGGQNITLTDGEVEYLKDGESEGEVRMTFNDMPENLAVYDMDATGTYRLEGDVIISQMTTVSLDPVGSDEQAAAMASQMAAAMSAGPESRSTIVSIDEDTLVLRDETTGLEISYTRD